eukprot:gene303-2397_t
MYTYRDPYLDDAVARRNASLAQAKLELQLKQSQNNQLRRDAERESDLVPTRSLLPRHTLGDPADCPVHSAPPCALRWKRRYAMLGKADANQAKLDASAVDVAQVQHDLVSTADEAGTRLLHMRNTPGPTGKWVQDWPVVSTDQYGRTLPGLEMRRMQVNAAMDVRCKQEADRVLRRANRRAAALPDWELRSLRPLSTVPTVTMDSKSSVLVKSVHLHYNQNREVTPDRPRVHDDWDFNGQRGAWDPNLLFDPPKIASISNASMNMCS